MKILPFAFGLALIMIIAFSGCASNVKQSVRPYYENFEIPPEWESLFNEKQAPKIELNFDIDTMLMYNIDLHFTPEIKNSLTKINTLLSKENCSRLENLLHVVSKYADYIGSKRYGTGLGKSNIFYSLKMKNLLAIKLFILLFYVNDEEIVNPIIEYVRINSNEFTQEYGVLVKLHKEVSLYRIDYQRNKNWLKTRWTDDLTQKYLGITPEIIPDDLLEIDCTENHLLEKLFNVEKFKWRININLPVYLICRLDYPYESYFNRIGRMKFLIYVGPSKIDQIYRIQSRIMFQQIRLKYFIYKNSLDVKMPKCFKPVYIDNFSTADFLDKELKKLKVLFVEWEKFAKKMLHEENRSTS